MANNNNILSIIKKIFMPPFCYNFDINVVNLHYSKKVDKKLNTLGAYIVEKNSDEYQFVIKTSHLLKRYRIGMSLISLRHKEKDKFNIAVKFQTQRMAFFIIATIISTALLISAVAEQKDVVIKLITIPIIFPFGHLYFLGSLAANVQRIKKFFIELGN